MDEMGGFGMELFGLSMEQVYMYTLLAAGALTVLYVFFGDAADAGDGIPFFNPTVVLAFVTLMAAAGYLFEAATNLNGMAVIGIAAIVAAVLDALLYFFILLPLSSAESSIAYTDESLLGQVAKVIVPIPVDGYGEVVIETYGGIISKRAAGFDNEAIEQERQVLIIQVNDGTLYVRDYEPMFSTEK
jgi:membrane protein implicated in regulation of membrane protease activity